MSYILDALKRADAERERGAVPGLHAQQNTALSPVPAARPRARIWLISTAVVVVSAIAAGLWLWRGPASDASLAAVQLAVVAPAPNPPATAPVAPLAAAPAAPAPVALPVPAAVPAPAVSLRPLVSAAPSVAAATVQSAASKAAPTASNPTPPAPVAAPTVPSLSELPEDIRRQIPALVITGAVYSETPGQRLLLVNNLVLNQGGLAAPEVSLEEIRPKSSVFNFRGTRFQVAH